MKLRKHPSRFGLAVGASSFRFPSIFHKLTCIIPFALGLAFVLLPDFTVSVAFGYNRNSSDDESSSATNLPLNTVAGPTLTSITPTSSERLATLNVIFTGTDFVDGATTVDMGPDVTINSVTFTDATSITANVTIASNAALGFRDVSVTNPDPDGGTATLNNAFAVNNPAPVFSEVNPNVAGRSETLDIIITGENFLDGVTTASFGSGITVNAVTVNSPTELSANISVATTATLGFRNVAVSNPAPGGGTATFVNAFSVVNPTPALTSAAPLLGLQGQALDVVLTGAGFLDGVTTVSFGNNVTINSMTVNSLTQITANVTIDANAVVGVRDVSVTNVAPGGGVATIAGGFTLGYNAPTFSNINPANGNRLQTLNVVLTGSNFIDGVTTVDFGADLAINSITINSATQLTANITIASNAVLGSRDVSITNPPPGGGSATLTNSFTLSNPAPLFTNLSPSNGNREQSLEVVISGDNFIEGVTSVSFGPDIAVNTITITNATQLTANITIANTAATGPRNLAVTNAAPGGGTVAFANSFNVNNAAPQLTDIAPAFVSRSQNVNVVLTGSHFYADASSIDFGPDIIINSTTVNSLTQITANITVGVNAALGARDIAVTNAGPGGGTAILAGGLTIGFPALTITSVNPNSGNLLQTLDVVVSGSNFLGGATTVSFGNDITVNTTTIDSATQLTANITIAATAALGARDVTVTNPEPGGGSATLTNGFTVNNPAPVLTNATPNSGGRLQTLDVVLNGSNFIAGVTSVNFGNDITVNATTINSATQLTANITIALNAVLGPREVIITNTTPGGGADTLTNGFTVNNPAPVLTSNAPNLGLQGQSLNVVLTGDFFIDGISSVSFGNDITVNSTTINSATQITVNLSIAANAVIGSRDVIVTNAGPGGGIATLTNGFTVGRPPVSLTSVNPVVGNRLQTLDVVLTGSNFITGATTASFGNGITINSTTVNSETQLTTNITITDSAASGPRAVSVSNPEPGSSTASLNNSFIINNPTPQLSSIAPNTGVVGATLDVTMTGSNFISGVTTVSFGTGIIVNTISVPNSSQMTVNISIAAGAALGARTVAVTNPAPGGGGATFINGFTITNPVPVLTSILPISGLKGQTLNVILTGNNFIGGLTTAGFGNDIVVNAVTVNSGTQLTANITIAANATTGSRDVSVTNPAPGGGSTTLAGGFTVNNAAPVLTSLAPASGARLQTMDVVLTGKNFINGVTSANFGNDVTINTTTVNSDTQLTVNLTIAATTLLGPRDVIVTNAAPGGGSAVLTDGFTVNNPAPLLTDVAPALGSQGQTLNVTLTGGNFINSISSVSFGAGITINSTAVTSDTQIVANITIAANAAAGGRDVKVTNAGPGGGIATLPNGFAVGLNAPTLTNVNPPLGTRFQTLNVTLTGSNFISGATTVNFGEGITINSTTVNSSSQITANITITSAAATGARSVSVTNPEPGGATATLNNAFTVTNPVPSLATATPNIGQRGQSLNVLMTGTNFIASVTTVAFGNGITVNTITVNSPEQMTVNLTIADNAALGSRNIVVSNPAPGGGSATFINGFTIANPAPVLASIAPTFGLRGQTLQVVLNGKGFVNGNTTINFGNNITINSITVNNDTLLTANLTIAANAVVGLREVSVTNGAPGGGTATLANGFTVGYNAPTLTNILPISGARLQTMNVVLSGSHFVSNVTTVNLGNDITVNAVTVNSDTQLTTNISIARTAALGTRDVIVTNPPPQGGSATLPNAFTIENPAPQLMSLAPALGGQGQTLQVTLSGGNFLSGISTVSFGDSIVINSTTVSNPGAIIVNITIGANAVSGTRNVSVTNPAPGGGTITLNNAFTVGIPAPTLTSVTPDSGNRLQSLDVVLRGSNFINGQTVVSFGEGIITNSITFNNSTQMTVNLSIAENAPLAGRDVTVSNPGPLGGIATLENGFTVGVAIPKLTSLNPAAGNRGDTMNVVMLGANFMGGVTTVDFGGGISVISTTVNPANGGTTQLTANLFIAANAALGVRDVSVTNPGGGTATLTNAFTVGASIPTLTRIAPANGLLNQTLDVLFTGSNFINGATTVSLGNDITINAITVNSDTQLTANITIDANAVLGLRDVSVTNPPPGGGAATLTNGFTVGIAAPTLISVAPNTGIREQTLDVVLTGTNFRNGVTSVNLGSDININSTTVNPASGGTLLTVNITIAANAVIGPRDVVVINSQPGGGTTTLTDAFTVSVGVPTLASISPTSGNRGQTLDVNLTGSNFAAAVTTVSFGNDVTINSVTVNPANGGTQLTANVTVAVNAVLGARDVSVTNPAPSGGTATLNAAFNVGVAIPTLTNIAPASGNRGQTLEVTMTGSNFATGLTTVGFGGGIVINSINVVSQAQMKVNITINADATLGARSVSATNPSAGGGTVTLQNAFTVGVSQPTLTTVAPASANRGQTLNTTLFGTNFVSDSTTVSFGEGVTVNNVTFNSASQITVNVTIANNAAPGSRNVSVTTPGGTVILPNAFAISVSAPTLTSIVPAVGSRNQTLDVVLKGSSFASGATTVSFGNDITINSTTVNSDTQLTANITIAGNTALGARAVSVSNPPPGGGSATLANGFSVGVDVPTLASIAPVSGNRLQTLEVVLKGTNFQSGITSVNFGNDITINSTTVNSDTQLTANITIDVSAATGPREVSVSNPPTSGTAVLTNAFTVTVGAPTVAAISPTSGKQNEILNLTVTGTNFFDGITSLGLGSGISVTTITVQNVTQLLATIRIDSLATLGLRNVTATNPAIAGLGGGTNSLANAFTVNAAVATKFLISGFIRTPEGTGVSGVVLNGLPNDPMTDATGFYQISVDPGFSGKVRPVKNGYTFAPLSRDYSNVQSDRTGQNYTANVEEKSFAFPNPFNPVLETIQIRFVVKNPANTSLKVMDAAGDVVHEIANPGGAGKTGELFVSWDGRNGRGEMVANGIYFYVITTGSQERITGKIAVLR